MNRREIITLYYMQHRDETVGFVAMRIHDADQAQDMVQDIFLRLLSGTQLISSQTLPSLVCTMARHAVSDYYRRRRVCEEYEHYISLHTDSTEAESVVNARLLVERMERSLARLPEACREVYRLHIYDGLQVSSIAEQLHLPYKQVENRLGQARKHVRRQLRLCV
ncbi:MAG: sigma-70 family RNA polymerase sigma factor [Prevotella sp.]|nr:sigma-70 family RNA polymerase sigma factor [Prevotella sp.]